MQHGGLVPILVLTVALGGPLLLGLAGLLRGRSADGAAAAPVRWDWRLSAQSAILYALTFNLVFFIQELFLVLPKALTPGLHPILYHNNHSWTGDNPLAALFQGTGALAIFLTGLACALLLSRVMTRSTALRLFLIWMVYQGLFQSLPQVVVGAFSPANDVGMAMDYLALSTAAKAIAALAALVGIVASGLWLTRPLLALAAAPSEIADPGNRSLFILRVATLPAWAAIPLIIAFRVPRELAEVIAPPIVVTVLGLAWIQANAWRVTDARPGGFSAARPVFPLLGALLILLLAFQLVLRPGIPFY
ncbi:MAG: hypothetical protein JO276_06990 [Sphingomonadaceae bacterium]|nr:hypothetical protein [Sphingomonadaceae bacterium]